MVHIVTRFVNEQRELDEEEAVLHVSNFCSDGKKHTIQVEREPDIQHMIVTLDGITVKSDDYILEYEIKDKWLLIHSATIYSHTSTSTLVNLATTERRLLTNVGGGWHPDPEHDFVENDYKCKVDFEDEKVHLMYEDKATETLSFAEVFARPHDRVIAVA